jgi:hypothetical protein
MEPDHVHHDYYQSLPDFEARLRVSILGRPDIDIEFPNIAERFAPYLGWLDRLSVKSIHFEDLIHERSKTLNSIIDHFLPRVPLQADRRLLFESLENSIAPSRSPTFRSGKTGEWKQHFTDEHKRLFKGVAGDLLIKLGFEENNDW